MTESVFRFAEALRTLLDSCTSGHLETRWNALNVEALGWDAVERARRWHVPAWERALDEVDGLLLRLLDRVPLLARGSEREEAHLCTFRLPALERLQHATAAALVAQRFGLAGLHTVVADGGAPLARRYFAFLALAERHPRGDWPLFAAYLMPQAHHAFVGTAAEAARFYPEADAASRLVMLFHAARSDLHLRAFLSPRILGSLYVLDDPATLPLFRELLTAGHTAPDPEHCEVTRALVMVRRFTGRTAPNSKYADVSDPSVTRVLDAAEVVFGARREILSPVVVI